MYNIVINIIAWLAILWLLVTLVFHIIVFIVSSYGDTNDYICIRRSTYFTSTEFQSWYIIPTISLEFGKYPELSLFWLKYRFDMCYHIMSEQEERIEAEVRKQLRQK